MEEKVIPKIKIKEHKVILNPDWYDIDLLIMKGDRVVGAIEVEVKVKWKKKKFPYKTVHFLVRKKKYAGKNRFYLIVSEKMYAVMIPFLELEKYEGRTIKTRYNRKEDIYDVPKKDCIWGWDNINRFLRERFI